MPLENIRILEPSTAYSPDEGVASGSLSIQGGGEGLRKACAELRALLQKSGAASYRDLIASGGEIPAEAPRPDDA